MQFLISIWFSYIDKLIPEILRDLILFIILNNFEKGKSFYHSEPEIVKLSVTELLLGWTYSIQLILNILSNTILIVLAFFENILRNYMSWCEFNLIKMRLYSQIVWSKFFSKNIINPSKFSFCSMKNEILFGEKFLNSSKF